MKNQDPILFVQVVVMVGRRRTVWGGGADGLCTSLEWGNSLEDGTCASSRLDAERSSTIQNMEPGLR